MFNKNLGGFKEYATLGANSAPPASLREVISLLLTCAMLALSIPLNTPAAGKAARPLSSGTAAPYGPPAGSASASNISGEAPPLDLQQHSQPTPKRIATVRHSRTVPSRVVQAAAPQPAGPAVYP